MNTASASSDVLTMDKLQDALKKAKRFDLQRRSGLSHALRRMSQRKDIWIREGDLVFISESLAVLVGIDTLNPPKYIRVSANVPSGEFYIIKQEALRPLNFIESEV